MVEYDFGESLKFPAYPTTTDVLFHPKSPGFIRSSDHVLVVGPGIQKIFQPPLPMDLSLVVLPSYLARGGGTITVFDAPDFTHSEFGSHSIEATKGWVKYLSDNLNICPIMYVEGALPQDTKYLRGRFDCIHDHLTTYDWILERNSDRTTETVDRIIEIYKSLLEPNGKMLIHYKNRHSVYNQIYLMEAMQRQGLIISDISPLTDRYDLSDELMGVLHHVQGLSTTGYLGNNQLWPYHQSEGILVGQMR